MADEVLDWLGDLYLETGGMETYGVTFEQFIELWREDRWKVD